MKKYKILLSVFMVIVIISLSVAPTLATHVVSASRAVISEDLAVVMEECENDEKIKVYLWYKDIDQDEVDVLATKETGLTPEKCEVIEEFPTTELISSLRNGEANAQAQMEAYMERTKPSREAERERTNRYIKTRREISNEKYSQKSKNIRNALSIDDNDNVFSSEFAPMIIAEMTKEEIEIASKNLNVEEISLYYEEVTENPSATEDEGVSAKFSMGLEKVYTVYGLTGEGVNVGLIEGNIPGNVPGKVPGTNEVLEIDLDEVTIVESADYPITPNKYVSTSYHWHPYNSLRVMAGVQTGIAKNINMYATNARFQNMEEILKLETEDGRTIDVANYNFSNWIYDRYHPENVATSIGEVNEKFAYHHIEKYLDYLIAHHNITIVVAGGNHGSHEEDWFLADDPNTEDVDPQWRPGARITSPGMAYNAITVGGYSCAEEDTISDDNLCNYSWKNAYGGLYGCAKPDVVMPADFPGRGTSVSSPAMTAQIALMLELKPSLALHPQLVKAIVLASCHRKVIQTNAQGGQELITDGITERQGAGAPDAWTMMCIVSQGTYGIGEFIANSAIINFEQPKYGATGMNISIAWLRENTDSNPDSITNDASDIVEGQACNIDLSVYQNDTLIKTSSLPYSSTEMCYLNELTSDNKYQIRITQKSLPRKVRYGYAWSTDNMYAPIRTGQDGVYYIKNKSNEKYITYDLASTTPQVTFENVASQTAYSDVHKWIVKRNNDSYNILTGYGMNELYLGQSSTASGTSLPLQLDTVAQNINIEYNEDGTVCLFNSAKDRILHYNGSALFWIPYDASTTTPTAKQKWYLEKVNYLCGDANMDGELESGGVIENEENNEEDDIVLAGPDQTFVQNYITDEYPLSNLQFYLADIDKDGYVTIMDAVGICRLVENKFY